MKAEHTKGPWRATIGEPLYVDEHAYGLGDCQVLDANDELVADINGTKEAPARARLIAAAPELLFAVKCLQADLQGAVELLDGECPDSWRVSIQEAEAAIAKATEE